MWEVAIDLIIYDAVYDLLIEDVFSDLVRSFSKIDRIKFLEGEERDFLHGKGINS